MRPCELWRGDTQCTRFNESGKTMDNILVHVFFAFNCCPRNYNSTLGNPLVTPSFPWQKGETQMNCRGMYLLTLMLFLWGEKPFPNYTQSKDYRAGLISEFIQTGLHSNCLWFKLPQKHFFTFAFCPRLCAMLAVEEYRCHRRLQT